MQPHVHTRTKVFALRAKAQRSLFLIDRFRSPGTRRCVEHRVADLGRFFASPLPLEVGFHVAATTDSKGVGSTLSMAGLCAEISLLQQPLSLHDSRLHGNVHVSVPDDEPTYGGKKRNENTKKKKLWAESNSNIPVIIQKPIRVSKTGWTFS